MTPEQRTQLTAWLHYGDQLQTITDGVASFDALLDALDAANAELSRLRSSPAPVVRFPDDFGPGSIHAEAQDYQVQTSAPAPVVGGVPEPTPEDIDAAWNDFATLNSGMLSDEPEADLEVFAAGYRAGASRLPALKPGEVETLLRIESCVRSLRDCGPEYIGAEECRLLDRLDALRAQPTPTEKETDHAEP